MSRILKVAIWRAAKIKLRESGFSRREIRKLRRALILNPERVEANGIKVSFLEDVEDGIRACFPDSPIFKARGSFGDRIKAAIRWLVEHWDTISRIIALALALL